MKKHPVISALFFVAAVYDGILGAAFLFASGCVFQHYEVIPPNHPGYVQFPAALLLIFGVMFAAIAIQPVRNRNLIPYGILLKVAYCGVITYHWILTDLPNMWKPFCIADVVFLVLFIAALKALGGDRGSAIAGATQ